jgi:hypothetical protein
MKISNKTNKRRRDKLFEKARIGEEGRRKERQQKELQNMHLSISNSPQSVPQNQFMIRGLGHKYMRHFLLIK